MVVPRDCPARRLVRRLAGKRIAFTITETEAHVGPHDLPATRSAAEPRAPKSYGPPR
jgi:3-methyladenine DNA glycosylase Mpg